MTEHQACKQCNLGNHDGCTGRVYYGDDSPKCECTHGDSRSPIEKLDDAIHEYAKAVAGDDWDGSVSGWTVGIETTSIVQIEGQFPLADAQWYALGPQTTTGQALGIARYLSAFYEATIVRELMSDD